MWSVSRDAGYALCIDPPTPLPTFAFDVDWSPGLKRELRGALGSQQQHGSTRADMDSPSRTVRLHPVGEGGILGVCGLNEPSPESSLPLWDLNTLPPLLALPSAYLAATFTVSPISDPAGRGE